MAPTSLRITFALALLLGLVAPALAEEKDESEDGPAKKAHAHSEAWSSRDVATMVNAARKARPSVLRIQWRSHRNPTDVHERNAVVVTDAGHLLMAGPAPDYMRGELTAELPPGGTFAPARFVANDPHTGLTLLFVNTSGLQPIELAPESSVAVDLPEAAERPEAVANLPAMPITQQAVRPLASLPMGMPVVLVSGDGGVAYGKVRAQDRPMRVRLPTGQLGTVTCLVEATITSLPSDLGAPWVDAEGRLLALQMATGLARAVPEDQGRAEVQGLVLRPRPTASRAVPVSVIRIVLPLLQRSRQVPRAGLGIRSEPGDEAVRSQLCQDHGCHVVTDVDPDGPGARAGLERHDLILTVQGEHLRPEATLRDVLLPFRPGDRVRLGVLRKGERIDLEATLAHWRR